jgi:signal transduction histidine kinase
MGFQIAAMIVGLLLVSATALWGLDGLHEDYGMALAGYQQLRDVYEVGSRLATAKSFLSPEHPDRGRALLETESAASMFDLSAAGPKSPDVPSPAGHDAAAEASVKAALAAAVAQLRTPPEAQAHDGDVLAADAAAVSEAMARISRLAGRIRSAIKDHQTSAAMKQRSTTLLVALVSTTVVVCAVLLGIMQYRGVMLPLGRLRLGVRKVAAGQFAQRLSPCGGEEFKELADEFNRMAGELHGFYHQLEQKVAQKSKELIRSERLASVGFLAAGVAHEINNPLGIISGYAEYSLEQLKQKAAAHTGANASNGNAEDELAKSLQIICDEAFRCKDITGKLLSLARQGDEDRHPVCLADIADKVVSIVGGLREYRDRRLLVAAPDGAAERRELCVSAIEAEMKQVVLNLTLNALEASPSVGGEVRIDVIRRGGAVELSVSDNGRGMEPQTLERVFEPFFTEKRGSGERAGRANARDGPRVIDHPCDRPIPRRVDRRTQRRTREGQPIRRSTPGGAGSEYVKRVIVARVFNPCQRVEELMRFGFVEHLARVENPCHNEMFRPSSEIH